MSRTINYFLDANSAKGYKDYFEENFKDKNIKLFKNISQKTIQEVMNEVMVKSQNSNSDFEFIHSCLDNSIIAIINNTENKGFLNLQAYCQNEKYSLDIKDSNAKKQLDTALSYAYADLSRALKIHDKWEEIYIKNIDFDELNKFTQEIIDKIFKDKLNKQKGVNINRFFGASTVYGNNDYILNITDKIQHRYFIKGRPGTGKSTMLKKIVKAANERGFDTYIYHCAFDPDSLDMVVIPKLNVCMFDSTSPHEHFTNKFCDEVIDIYSRAVAKNTDEKFASQLNEIQEEYHAHTLSAKKHFNDAKVTCDKIEISQLSSDIISKEVLETVL